jgi:hypothetical protein
VKETAPEHLTPGAHFNGANREATGNNDGPLPSGGPLVGAIAIIYVIMLIGFSGRVLALRRERRMSWKSEARLDPGGPAPRGPLPWLNANWAVLATELASREVLMPPARVRQ